MNAQPVDVLAVMDRAAPIVGNSDHGDAYAVLTLWPEVRAAVAKLTETHDILAAYLNSGTPNAQRLMQSLRDAVGKDCAAALARVDGAK